MSGDISDIKEEELRSSYFQTNENPNTNPNKLSIPWNKSMGSNRKRIDTKQIFREIFTPKKSTF